VHRFFETGKRIPETGKNEHDAPMQNLSGIRYPLSGLSWIHPTAQVSASAQLLGATAVGPRVKIGDGAALTDCIVWEDAEIGFGTCLENCIVTAAQRVQGTYRDTDF